MAEIDPMRAFGLLNDADLEGEASQELGQDQGVVQGPPRLGELVEGRFRLMAPIGKGGMGTVFLGRDEELDREVAIKLLSLGGTAARQRFTREAEVTARLNHPHVIRIHGSGQVRGHPYLVYELIEGGRSFEQVLAEAPLSERLDLLEQVASGLAAAHQIGVVHRDLKPENVLIRLSGEAVVADFGLAGVDASSLTKTGQSMGTPAYMAPEQIRGEPATPACDVWALGLLLYEALFQDHAFLDEGSGLQALLARIYEARLDLPRGGPPALRSLIERTLVSDPTQRLPDAGAFLEALREARLGGRRVSRGLVVGVGVAVAVFGLLVIGLAASSSRPDDVGKSPAPTATVRVSATVVAPSAIPRSAASAPLERAGWAHKLRNVRAAAFLGERLLIRTRNEMHVFGPDGSHLKRIKGKFRILREGPESLWVVGGEKALRLRWDLELEFAGLYAGLILDCDPSTEELLVFTKGGLEIHRAGGAGSGLVRRLETPPLRKGLAAFLLPDHVLVSTWKPGTHTFLLRRGVASSANDVQGQISGRASTFAYSWDRKGFAIGNGNGSVFSVTAGLESIRPLTRRRDFGEGKGERSYFNKMAVQAHLNKVAGVFLKGDHLLSYSLASDDPGSAVLWDLKTPKALVVRDTKGLRAFALSRTGLLAVVGVDRVEFTPLAGFR